MRAVYSQFILTLCFSRKEKNGTLPWVPFLGGGKKRKISPFHGRMGEIFTTRVEGTRGGSEKMIMFRRHLRVPPIIPKNNLLGDGRR